MSSPPLDRRSCWCIVVADDPAPDWVPYGALELKSVPVQYCRLGDSATLLHRALHRAASVAPASQILVTALEEYRDRWEPMLWSVRPELRFVCDRRRTASQLTVAAAIVSIAKLSPSSIVTILPAPCYVAHESLLSQALQHVANELPHIPEGAATLGMLDIDESLDEDYLVVGRAAAGPGLAVRGIARRPTAWVARHLRRQGAVVASGITVGYAGVLAAHLSKQWPGIASQLMRLLTAATAAQVECEIPETLLEGVPSTVLKSLTWSPPALPQRVFTVCQSGWSGLKSPQEITRIMDFLRTTDERYEAEVRTLVPSSGRERVVF
jgi:mannose-1-phosphate guanylyltransferase